MKLTNSDVVAGAFDNERDDAAGMLDFTLGGQQGFMHNMGTDLQESGAEWINNGAFVKKNSFLIVLEVPQVFKYLSNPKFLTGAYVALLETQLESFGGLTNTLTAEFEDHVVGHSGMQFSQLIGTKREQTAFTCTIREKPGKPVNRLLDLILRYGGSDPDTQAPLVSTLASYDSIAKKAYTADLYSGTVLIIEPDWQNRNVSEAYLLTNFTPETAGENTSGKESGALGQLVLYDISWKCMGLNNPTVRHFAQTVMEELTILKVNPDKIQPFIEKASGDVKDAVRRFNSDPYTNEAGGGTAST